MIARKLFEAELQLRNIPFHVDAESGRHTLQAGESQIHVSLDNLERDLTGDDDIGRVSRFVDAVMIPEVSVYAGLSADQLYWCLEPGDYEVKADFYTAVSDRVDRALVQMDQTQRQIRWVTPGMLERLGLREEEAGAQAFSNLERALREATIEFNDIDGVRLGYLGSPLPFKASLLLAPNLREVAGPVLGWPLMAVAPDRGFLYLWAARHTDFIPRVGGVVLREYSKAPYPISTEVFEITDEEIRAIGAYSPKNE